MYDSGITAKDFIATVKDEADITVAIPDASWYRWISTVEQMDKIVFVDDGKIVAVGKHDELYAGCPEYRTMVDLQKLDDAEENEGQVGHNA